MKSIVQVEINAPVFEVANLFVDPRNSPKWMLDLDRYEPVSGERGEIGSTYRLVPKKGNMVFLATVIRLDLPHDLCLHLSGASVDVTVTGKLKALSPTKTQLVSEELFEFKGLLFSIFSVLARNSIRSAHRQHIEDFKRFVERTLEG
jgi:hypothetical protein